MNYPARIRTLLRSVFRRSHVEQEIRDELRFHIESYADDLVRGGMSREQALRRARIEFGNLESKKEECRTSLGVRLWDELRSDVRYALRVLSKSPGFAVVAVLTLALGIGDNAAIFSLVDALILRRLPVQKPQELFSVTMVEPGRRTNDSFTNPLWESLRDQQDVFSGMLAWAGPEQFDLARGGAVQNVQGLFVSGGYFDVLGVAPLAGRLLSTADDHRGCTPVAVLSYGFWQSHFGGLESAIGSTVALRGHPFQIMGVAPPRFHGIEVGKDFDLAVPLCASAPFDARNLDSRNRWWLRIIGRVKPDITPEQLKARLQGLSQPVLNRAMPEEYRDYYEKHFPATRLVPSSAADGSSYFRESFGQPLTILMLMVGTVLLVACANITSLMLAKITTRAKEIAIRKALGASRARVVRQVMTESVLLSLLGAVAGIVFARWGSAMLVRSISTGRNPVFLDLSANARVLAFTSAVALLTGILTSVLPAAHSGGIALIEAMKTRSDAGGDAAKWKIGRWIVAGQVALSLVLLVGGGLLLRTFVKLMRSDLGFDPHNVLVVSAKRPWWAGDDARIAADRRNAAYDEIAARLRSLPGVVSVSRSFTEPLRNDNWGDQVQPDTASAPVKQQIWFNFVTPEYFATMRTPVLAGRNFNAGDTRNAPLVALVNETSAGKLFPGVNPIGHRFRKNEWGNSPPAWVEIVGIVKDAKYGRMRETPSATVYIPVAQAPPGAESDDFMLRTAVPPQTLIPVALRAVAELHPELPLSFHTISDLVSDDVAQERIVAVLAGFFAVLALALAMIGLYGVLSFAVTHRQVEFGIRMALGAGPNSILRLVMRDVAVVLVSGIAVGVVASLFAAKLLQKLLFGLAARDPVTIIIAVGLLSATAALAAYLPARRATRVDPMVALRYE